MWKWIVGAVISCVLICGVGGYFVATSGTVKQWTKGLAASPPATLVVVEQPEIGELTRTISAPGAIRPRIRVAIKAQVSSRILDLPFQEGQDVREGDVIVRLDDRDLAAALESAQAGLRSQEATLEGAQASLIQAKAELERVRTLHQSGDRSLAALQEAEAQYLRAESQLRVSEHSIEVAKASIRRAERDLENTLIQSPVDGTIVRLPVNVGETVLGTFNNEGTLIMLIADLSQMELYAQVDESNIAPIHPGQRATVYLISYPDKEFSGTVERVGLERQATSDGTGVFDTEILLDPSEELRLSVGMTANTDIEVEKLDNVTRVPSQAVIDVLVEELPEEIKKNEFVKSEKTFATVVYRMVDGKAVVTPVQTGPSDLTHTAVLGGLDPDAKIITGPYKVLVSLKHDQAVRVEEPKPAPESAEPAAEQVAGQSQTQGS